MVAEVVTAVVAEATAAGAKAEELSARQMRDCGGGRLAEEVGIQRTQAGQGGREEVGGRAGRRGERSKGGAFRGAERAGRRVAAHGGGRSHLTCRAIQTMN